MTGQIRLEDNPADLLTKVVTGKKWKHLMSIELMRYMMESPFNGSRFLFPELANPFHDSICSMYEHAFEGTREFRH